MATYIIDTAEAIKHLKQHGFKEEQAEAIVHTFGRTQDDLVSKKDLDLAIEGLRKDIEHLATREELKNHMLDVKDQMIDIQKQMNTQLKWIVVSIFGAAGLLFAALKFFE